MWGISKRKKATPYKRLEGKVHKAFGSGIEIVNSGNPNSPLVLASPHSGRHYPDAFLDMSKLPLSSLKLGEDSYMDQLILPMTEHNIPVIHAKFPRCFVDVNRSASEIPPEFLPKSSNKPAFISPRAQSGLGVVPSRIAQNLDIYDYQLLPYQVSERIDRYYHPYHDGLRALIRTAQERFGTALVIDCHSMPGHGPGGDKRPDVILGDRYGKSCHASTTLRLENAFQARGYSVSRNNPYAGGFVTRHYGRPLANVEVIQIEINKLLYLDAATFEPNRGLERLNQDFRDIILDVLDDFRALPGLAAQ